MLLGADNKETAIVVRKRKQGTSYRYTQHLYLPPGVEMSAVTATGFTLGCDKCQWDPVGYHNRGGRCACTGCSGCRHMLLGCERCRHRLGPRRPRTRQRRSKMSKGLAAPGDRSNLSDYPAMATLPRAATEDQVWARPKGGNVDRHINRGRMERVVAKSTGKANEMAVYNHEMQSGYRGPIPTQYGAQAAMGPAYGPAHGHSYVHPSQMVEPPYHMPSHGPAHSSVHGPPHVAPYGPPHGPPHGPPQGPAYGYAPARGRLGEAPHNMEMSQVPLVRLVNGDPHDPRLPYRGPHMQPHPGQHGQQPHTFPSSAPDTHLVEPGLTGAPPMGSLSPVAQQERGQEANPGAGADAKLIVSPIKKEDASADADANGAGVQVQRTDETMGAVNLLANLAQAASKMDGRSEVGRKAARADMQRVVYVRHDPRWGPIGPLSKESPAHGGQRWSVEGSCWDSQAPDDMYTTSYWMCGGGAVPPPVFSSTPGTVSHRTRGQSAGGGTIVEVEGAIDRRAHMVEGAIVEPHAIGLPEGSMHGNYAEQMAVNGSQRKRMREEGDALHGSIHDVRAPHEYDERQGHMGYESRPKTMRYATYAEPRMVRGCDALSGHHPGTLR